MFSFFRRQKTTDADKDKSKDGGTQTAQASSPPAEKKKDYRKGRDAVGAVASRRQEPATITGLQTREDVKTSTSFGVREASSIVQRVDSPVAKRPTISTVRQADQGLLEGAPTPKEAIVERNIGVETKLTVVKRRDSSGSPEKHLGAIQPTQRSDAPTTLTPPVGVPTLPEVPVSAAAERMVPQIEREREAWEAEKRNLVNQEERFREQLADLGAQLTARDSESSKLLHQMEDLQRDVMVKTSGMDRLQAELEAAHKECESTRARMRSLETDLSEFKQKNMELADELVKRSDEVRGQDCGDCAKVEALEINIQQITQRLKELEEQLQKVQEERDRLEEQRLEMEEEREEEMHIVQEALEEAQQEKFAIQARFEQDFERLRTVNTDREQQLLDDFEWKLREVQQACKRRLEEKDRAAEERVKRESARTSALETEMAQMRGLNLDQQRALRQATRVTEQLQVNEKILQEEVSSLRTALANEKAHATTMLSLHGKQLLDFEKKLQARLDQQKSELTAFWEDRLRQECDRLKMELEELHEEEKKLAMDSIKLQKEQELQAAKEAWEFKMKDTLKEITTLKNRLMEKDEQHQEDLERAQTNADRDVFELRRKLDKLDMSYQEQIEKLTEDHERKIEEMQEETERRKLQLEQNSQLQMASTRTTLGLVKEQMERDAQTRLEALEDKHREQLGVQWAQLTQEKEDAVAAEVERHRKEVERVKQELEMALKARNSKESELLETITNLRQQLQGQATVISDLQGNVELLQGGLEVLNGELSNKDKKALEIQQQAEQKLRESEAQLEAKFQKKLAELNRQHNSERQMWQKKMQSSQEQFTAKIKHLTQLLHEAQSRCKNPSADAKVIAELRRSLQERDRQLAKMNEEKRFYQMELVNREATYSHMLGAQPMVSVVDTLLHQHSKGGGKKRSQMTSLPGPVSKSRSSTNVPCNSSIPLPRVHVQAVPVAQTSSDHKTSQNPPSPTAPTPPSPR